MPAIAWDQSLSANAQENLYQLYLLLFKATGLSARNKQRSFEAAADGPHSWSIVGITTDALKHVCESGNCDGLQRAHIAQRSERAVRMFERREPFARAELFAHFFGLDSVVLATRPENGRHARLSEAERHDIPAGFFTKSGMKSVAMPGDLKWATDFARQRGLQFTPYQAKPRRQKKK